MGPGLRKPPAQDAVVFSRQTGFIGLGTYDVLRQRVVSHHFTFGDGRQAEVVCGHHRYIWPAELDRHCLHRRVPLTHLGLPHLDQRLS